MSIVAAIRRMLGLGIDLETALAAAEAFEAESEPMAPTPRQLRNARYYAGRKRLKASETSEIKTSKTIKTDSDVSDASPTCAQVVSLTSSLRSEGIPLEKPSVSIPKGTTERGHRLPDGWRPDEVGMAYAAEQLGPNVDPERELDRFRDHWRSQPGGKARKADWPATWRNWVRRAADTLPRSRQAHERPDQSAKLAAKQANYDRAWAGSERAAGQRWEP